MPVRRYRSVDISKVSRASSPSRSAASRPALSSPALGRELLRPQRVLFVAASPLGPMAAICFEALTLGARATATFASRRGKARQSPAIGAMMREVGVHGWKSMERTLDASLVAEADLVITIGRPGRPRDPKLPGVPRRLEHWAFVPRTVETQAPVRARKLRDAVRARVAMLVFMEGWGRPEMSRETERLSRPTATEGHYPFIPVRPFRVEPHLGLPH